MVNYFFTADTEFNHNNIIKYCNRPFNSVDEMNESIVTNWNRVITKKDIVYHLGDVGRNCDNIVKRLNGNIFFVKGSHDKKLDAPHIREIYIPNLLDEYGNKRLIVLCHYSMRSWNKSHYASWHLFGHHHGLLNSYGLSFDVGMDTNDYYPYSLPQIEQKMNKLSPIIDFRKENK